jgi:hypothetical protein
LPTGTGPLKIETEDQRTRRAPAEPGYAVLAWNERSIGDGEFGDGDWGGNQGIRGNLEHMAAQWQSVLHRKVAVPRATLGLIGRNCQPVLRDESPGYPR